MKTSLIVLAVFCSCMASAYSLRLPQRNSGILGQEEIGPIDNYTCPDDGLFPHEECDLFVSCWDNRAVLWRCTEEMLFDLRYNGCDYAENVDCGERNRPPTYPGTRTPPTPPTVSTTPDPSPPPNDTFSCPENGVYPHSERCEYYWNCWEGVANLERCPMDYLFDLVYDGCNFPEMVDCGSRLRPEPGSTTTGNPGTSSSAAPTENTSSPTTTTTTRTTTSPPNPTENPPVDFECPRPNGVFPDPEDCSGFYTCLANTPIHNFCPEGLHFNPNTEDCDWPEEAGCSSQ